MRTILKTHVLSMAAIAILGAVLYGPMLRNDFIYNDYEMAADNSFITSPANLKSFFDKEYFTGSREGSYRPLVTLSFMADYAVWGRQAFGFHLTNLIFHIANGTLLYLMLVFMMPLSRSRPLADGKGFLARISLPLAAALLFISHPAGTEGVLSIGSRHEMVTGVFYTAAVCLYIMSRSGAGVRPVLCYALSLAAYFLSMMSKEMGVMVPAFILLADMFPAEEGGSPERGRPSAVRNLAAYAGYALVAMFYFYLRFVKMTHPVQSHNAYFSAANLFGGEPLTHFMTVMVIMKDYLLLLLFPLRLSLEYVVNAVPSPASGAAVLSLLAVLAVIAAAFSQRRARPIIFLGWAWFFIAIFPASNLALPLLSTRMSERFLYLPMAGYCMFLAALLFGGSGQPRGNFTRLFRKAVPAVFAAILILYSARTFMRVLDWHDSRTFWEKAAKTESGSFRTHNNLAMQYYYSGQKDKAVAELNISLGLLEKAQTRVNLGFVYLESGELEKASAEFGKAMEDDPEYAPAYYHMAVLEMKRDNYEQAQELLEKAVAMYPQLKDRPFEADTHNALGLVLSKKGMKDKAIEEYMKAIEIRSDFNGARLNLARLYMDSGAPAKASEELETALAADPGNREIALSLGYAYAEQGLDAKAAQAFTEVLKAAPEDVATRYVLAGTYLRMRALDKAEAEYLEILRLQPLNADSLNNLANIYSSRGLMDKAIEGYANALKIDPAHFKARNNLANVYLLTGRYDMAVDEYKKVLEARPGDAVVRYNLGLAYEGKGMFAEAAKEWEEVLRIDPTFVQAGEALRRMGGK